MNSQTVLEGYYAVYRGAQDCKAAVRFFRNRADSLMFDPNQIYMIGFSAGGFNAAHTAFWQSNEVPIFAIPPGSGSFETGTSTPGVADTISGFVNVAGGLGDTLWMNGEKVAVACIHNLLDPVVPYQNGTLFGTPVTFGASLFMANRAAQQGNFSRMKSLNVPNLHLPDPGSPWADTIEHYIFKFLHEMLCRNRSITNSKQEQNDLKLSLIMKGDGLHLQSSGKGELKIYDGSGKVKADYEFQTGSHLFPILSLKPGIYYILAQTGHSVVRQSFIFYH